MAGLSSFCHVKGPVVIERSIKHAFKEFKGETMKAKEHKYEYSF